MRSRRTSRGKVVGAVVGALLLLADTAAAHHVSFGIFVSDYGTGAYADFLYTIGSGNSVPADLGLDFPVGWQFAQQGGTSPLTPTPIDEEQIGSGSMRARFQPFCLSSSTLGLTVRWEANMSGAPANAVAHYTITGGVGLFEFDAWLIRTGSADYELSIPDMPDSSVCSSTTDFTWALTLFGTTALGNQVVRNPLTPGTYTFTISVVDTMGTLHTQSHTITIT